MIEKTMPALGKLSTAMNYVFSRTPIAITKGYLVYSSYGMENEDIICILLGCDYPVILRPCGENWKLVGECIIYEVMKGEGLGWLEEVDCLLEEFVIC